MPLNPSKNEENVKTASFWQLFHFADKKDKALMAVACLLSMTQGALLPAISIFFGDLSNSFSPLTGSSLVSMIRDITLKMVWVGIGVGVAAISASFIWIYTASR